MTRYFSCSCLKVNVFLYFNIENRVPKGLLQGRCSIIHVWRRIGPSTLLDKRSSSTQNEKRGVKKLSIKISLFAITSPQFKLYDLSYIHLYSSLRVYFANSQWLDSSIGRRTLRSSYEISLLCIYLVIYEVVQR